VATTAGRAAPDRAPDPELPVPIDAPRARDEERRSLVRPQAADGISSSAGSPHGWAYYRLALVLGALTAMGPLAIDTYLPALPTIARELRTTATLVQVSLSAYFVGIALGQAVYGPLSDRLGRKPALYAGLGLFIAASLGCALAPGVEALIAFRLLQALGGCAPLVIPRAIVRDHFNQRDSVRMLSVLMLVMGLAPILAPLVGGQLLVHLGWRSIFWAHAAYGTFWLVAVAGGLNESLALERRRREPVRAIVTVYWTLLRDWPFMREVLAGGLVFSGLLAYISGSPFVFIELFHVSPERFGLYFGANAIGIISASQINRWLAHRIEPKRVLRGVLPVSLGAGVTLLVDAWTGFGGFAGILIPLFVFIATHGFVMPNTTALAMEPHGSVAGSASAILGSAQFVLGALAGALVGAAGNGTAVPLAAVIAGCGAGAFLVHEVHISRLPRLRTG
jgi:DHA1 family bicyclomycin/chloramphenicol resistance-like MFS transporter